MRNLGTIENFVITWTPPEYDGGTGSGEVMVGLESAGFAQTEREAMEVARAWIARWKG